jgi:hypothetical protein
MPKTCKYSFCLAEFIPSVNRPLQYTCSPRCQRLYHAELKANRKPKQPAPIKEIKYEPSANELEKQARKYFQIWIKLRDKSRPCISCGRTEADEWHGGHYLKAELFSGLIFHPRNCHKQCAWCNGPAGCTDAQYRFGLVQRYGEQYVVSLEALKDQNREYKFSRPELIEIIKEYKSQIKILKKAVQSEQY